MLVILFVLLILIVVLSTISSEECHLDVTRPDIEFAQPWFTDRVAGVIYLAWPIPSSLKVTSFLVCVMAPSIYFVHFRPATLKRWSHYTYVSLKPPFSEF